MAKRASEPVRKVTPAKPADNGGASSRGPVRNTPLPKPQPHMVSNPIEITHEMIARKAYEISLSPECSSEFDNWCRAERELRGA